MKSFVVLLSLLFVFATAAYAQADMNHAPDKGTPSPSKQAFDAIKTLAGEWEGRVTLTPPMQGMGETKLHLTMRVTSRGHAIVHEFQEAGTPLDPAKYDHPVTMFYLDDQDQVSLVHYCDAGNRPHMVARKSPDNKTIEFDFVDMSGGNQHGHMHHAVFTLIDADHHTQEWTYMMPGDKPMRARMDLTRVK